MTDTDHSSAAFEQLHALWLIAQPQRDAALAHPMRGQVAGIADPAAHLAWLIEHRLVQHAGLGRGPCPEAVIEEFGTERSLIVWQANELIKRHTGRLNREMFDRLLRYRLISQSERRAIVIGSHACVLFSEGEALADLVRDQVLTRERFAALTNTVRAERHWPDGPTRAAIVDHAQRRIGAWDREQMERDEDARRGLRWSILDTAVVLLLLAAGAKFAEYLFHRFIQ